MWHQYFLIREQNPKSLGIIHPLALEAKQPEETLSATARVSEFVFTMQVVVGTTLYSTEFISLFVCLQFRSGIIHPCIFIVLIKMILL